MDRRTRHQQFRQNIATATQGIGGEHVFITGASSGIGQACALAFAAEGCKLYLTFKGNMGGIMETSRACQFVGAASVFVEQMNQADDASIKRACNGVIQACGNHIDVLVNNAGMMDDKPFKDKTFEDITEQIDVNLEGPMKVTLCCLPYLKRAIINIDSVNSFEGHKGMTTYAASKFGVRGWTQAMAKEFPNLSIYPVHPDKTNTDMSGHKGRPAEQVAAVVVKAAKGGFGKSGSDLVIPDIYGNSY